MALPVDFAYLFSSQETAPNWQGIQNARYNHGTENSMVFFRGKALALQTLKPINVTLKLHYCVCKHSL